MLRRRFAARTAWCKARAAVTCIVTVCRSEQVPAVFSPAFMRCLNNHRSSAATALHTAAKRCLQRIAAVRAAAPGGGGGHLQAAISAALSRHTGFGAAVVGKAQVRLHAKR